MTEDLRSLLKKMSIAVKDDNNKYRSAYDILFDLSKKYNTLCDEEKQKETVCEFSSMNEICTYVVTFDKDNQQQDYQYMAKDLNGKYVVGYMLVEKQWYSSAEQWTYYIVSNEYNGRGICGGAEWSGFNRRIR